MKPQEQAAQAMWPDAMDWLVTQHGKEISNFYQRLLNSYLSERFGRLTPQARSAMLKTLIKNIIQ